MGIIPKLIRLYEIVIFVRIILSWVPQAHFHPATQFLHKITEPVLGPVRRIVPPVSGFDISPIIVIFGLEFLRHVIP